MYDLRNTTFDWGYLAEVSNKASKSIPNGVFMPRGKFIGGSGGKNIMLYSRGNSRDYNQWESNGNPTWGWNSISEYFEKSLEKDFLKIESFKNTENINEIIKSAGLELNHPFIADMNIDESLGLTELQGGMEINKKISSAKAFLIPAKDRTNLHVIKNAQVTKIDFSPEGSVSGVHFTIGTNNLIAKAIKEVILSAGAINTPQILMLSGIGPEKILRKLGIGLVKSLQVGKNLQDHVTVPFVMTIPNSKENTVVDSYYEFLIHKTGPMTSPGNFNLMGFFNTNKTDVYPDIQIQYVYLKKQCHFMDSFLTLLGYDDEISKTLRDGNLENDLMISWITLLNPRSTGKIKMEIINSVVTPRIELNLLSKKEDVDTLIRGIKTQQEFLQTTAFTDNKIEELKFNIVGCSKIPYGSDKYWECYIRHLSTTMNNPVGTAKMGNSTDWAAVVDPRLVVRGLKGLRIADASIMPTIVSGGTYFPTVMIGEKAADFIKEDWVEGDAGHVEL